MYSVVIQLRQGNGVRFEPASGSNAIPRVQVLSALACLHGSTCNGRPCYPCRRGFRVPPPTGCNDPRSLQDDVHEPVGRWRRPPRRGVQHTQQSARGPGSLRAGIRSLRTPKNALTRPTGSTMVALVCIPAGMLATRRHMPVWAAPRRGPFGSRPLGMGPYSACDGPCHTCSCTRTPRTGASGEPRPIACGEGALRIRELPPGHFSGGLRRNQCDSSLLYWRWRSSA
jgi:hypothetical protein